MADGSIVTIVSYAGVYINSNVPGHSSVPFVSLIGNDISSQGNFLANMSAQVIETERPGRTPVYVRAQPASKQLIFDVVVTDHSQDNLTLLQAVFDPTRGQQYLVVVDDNGNTRRTLCQYESQAWVSPFRWRFIVRSSSGLWEHDTLESATATVTASGQATTATTLGSAYVRPKFTITPNATKAHSLDYINRRRISIANRSELALFDPVGMGYPIDIVDAGFDTAGQVGLGHLLSSMNDLRVILSGEEQYRWLAPATPTVHARIWCNLSLRPRKVATLAVAIGSATGTLSVNNAEGFAGWPSKGYLMVGTECIRYSSRTGTTMVIVRGARTTTPAAHAVGTTLYWLEHAYLDLIYNYTAAQAPVTPIDQAPMINLNTSNNTDHQWPSDRNPGYYFNNSDLRTRAWQRALVEDPTTSGHTQLTDDGGPMVFEDLLPSQGRPNFNNAIIDFPVPIKNASGVVLVNLTVHPLMVSQGYALDLDGNESRLYFQFVTSGSGGTTLVLSTGDSLTRLRLYGRVAAILGDLDVTTEVAYPTVPLLTIYQPINNPIAAEHDPKYIIYETQLVPAVHFRLDAETDVDGLSLYTENCPFMLFTGSPTGPDRPIASGSFSGGGFFLKEYFWPKPLALPAGDYWVMLGLAGTSLTQVPQPPSQIGVHSSRTEANVFYGQHFALFQNVVWRFTNTTTGETADVALPDTPIMHQNHFDISPIFAVLSKTTPSQPDAPLATSEAIIVTGIQAQLDDTRAPLINVGLEEPLYLMQATIANSTTGESISLFFPMAVGQSLEIDCENRTVTDLETGTAVMFAIVGVSSPEEWLRLAPGANTITYTELGVVNTTLNISWRSQWF